MCLAIPMRIIKISGDPDDLLSDQIAIVESEGVSREVRLDIIDRWPTLGDYIIIHAGFAIHALDAEEAENNLIMLRKLANEVN